MADEEHEDGEGLLHSDLLRSCSDSMELGEVGGRSLQPLPGEGGERLDCG